MITKSTPGKFIVSDAPNVEQLFTGSIGGIGLVITVSDTNVSDIYVSLSPNVSYTDNKGRRLKPGSTAYVRTNNINKVYCSGGTNGDWFSYDYEG